MLYYRTVPFFALINNILENVLDRVTSKHSSSKFELHERIYLSLPVTAGALHIHEIGVGVLDQTLQLQREKITETA